MKKKTPVIIIRSLGEVRGGITRATFTRANALAKHYKNVKVITFLYQQSHNKIIKDLYEKGLLAKNVQVLNFFEDIKSINKKAKKPINEQNTIKEKGLNEFIDQRQKKEPSYRYYKNGLYVKYKRFSQEGNLKFIDYMNESRYRIRREEFDEKGFLVRTRHMDIVNNKPRLDRYFSNDKNCFLTVWINPETENEEKTVSFNEDPKEYKTLYECQTEWLQSKLDKIKYPCVMTEQRSLDKMVRKINHENIKKISVVHGNHLETPFNDITRLKKGYSSLFDHVDEIDNIVFLTNEQKRDVEEVYGPNKGYCVIPHPCKQIDNKAISKSEMSFNPFLAVTLARFHEDKRLDEAIRAFQYVVEKIPDAKYYIYGFGPAKRKLLQLIKELNLEDNVLLEKYVTDPSAVYETAACSILTSAQEAFAMVITESLAEGTPVVSYDTKYGPNDIIREGIDGYIVPMGDKKELAKKIIKIMESKLLRNKLSKNATEVREIYSKEKYINNWLKLINSK